jgi:transcriptional regulator with GAF, ATPase, and Fis domain
MSPVLRAVSGPLRGATFRLVADEVTVGRQPSNHLCIGDLSVSRSHCVLSSEGGRHKVKDLKSHNGTLVNGNAVTECFLAAGDRLTVGDTVFEFLEDSSSAPELPVPVGSQETKATPRVAPSGNELNTLIASVSNATGKESSDRALLARIGKLLNSPQKVEELELQILELIGEFARADKVAAFLIRRGEWVAFGWDESKGSCATDFARRDLVDRAFKIGKPVVADRVPRNSDWGQGSISVLATPLIIRDAIGGVIYLERCYDRRPFTDADLEFVTAVSNYVAVVLGYSQELENLEAENRRMRHEVDIRHEMIGQSARMQEVYERIARIAPTDATVMIRGETGTGKELAARAIHENSPRAGQVFEAINCALLKRDLLESELFGHEKGAFTGAVTQKKGKLELADGGTVFLDEVAELPEGPQSMLLRVLQERTFERLGGTSKIHVDIRIITATNKTLEESVRKHKFRNDLYYRLNVVSVHMPALRERRDDIPLLADHFLRRTSAKNKRVVTSISPEAMAYLQAYDWPGNVRELENAIEHAVVFGWTDQVMPEDLPARILERAPHAAVPAINYQDAVRNAKRQIVLDALQRAGGDHSKAAQLLQIHPNNLYRLIRDLEVKPARASKSA